jgi:Transglutaminase-like superfamily
MQNNSEIKALLHLLDDPDEMVFTSVKNKIISYGRDILPNLEGFSETTTDQLLQIRIDEIIKQVTFEEVLGKMEAWASKENQDLLEGMLIMNQYRFADPKENETRKLMKTIYQSTWLEMNNYLAPMEQVNVLASIIYNMYRLQNQDISAENINGFFINHLLNTKTGNVLSLNSVYLILCDLLSIPIKPINLPGQFLLGYVDTVYDYLSPTLEPKEKILFYIDASSGMVYTQSDVDAYLKKSNFPLKDPSYDVPMTNKEYMKLYLQTLLKSYGTIDMINEREKEILQLIEMVS